MSVSRSEAVNPAAPQGSVERYAIPKRDALRPRQIEQELAKHGLGLSAW